MDGCRPLIGAWPSATDLKSADGLCGQPTRQCARRSEHAGSDDISAKKVTATDYVGSATSTESSRRSSGVWGRVAQAFWPKAHHPLVGWPRMEQSAENSPEAIEAVVPNSWPPQFTLDQERILRLLTGDRFYSNASAALREAVLNGLDAVHRRRRSEPQLPQDIRVTFDVGALTMSVADNGDGMDRSSVNQLFTRVGASASNLQNSGGTVGEFGIGVISYFMAGDSFTLQTWDGISEPLGLAFEKSMLAGGPATALVPTRTDRGTTVTIKVRDQPTFDLLVEKVPHWCRDVEGLAAISEPGQRPIRQGQAYRPSSVVDVPLPDWIERAHLSPVLGPSSWNAMSGSSTISVLYRGVFVQEFIVAKLWGVDGSIDVDPKHFRPRLNREGFVGNEFRSEVELFLRQAHPAILLSMADSLRRSVEAGQLAKWDEHRWATLWLSIPRDQAYATAASAWDHVFRTIPAFELAVGDGWRPLSLNDLLGLGSEVYVAPHRNEQLNDLVKGALRLLRHTKGAVIRGLQRDRQWLKDAPNYFSTTADLIAQVFASELPKFIPLASEAEKIIAAVQPAANLYGGPTPVDLVRIGSDSPPVLRLSARLIVNIDHSIGRAIVEDALTHNSGRWSLVEIIARRSHEHLSQVAAALRDSPVQREELGLVKRRFIRGLLS